MFQLPPLRSLRRWLPLGLVAAALLVVPACGDCDDCCEGPCCDGGCPPAYGYVYLDNLTDLGVPEFCLGFYLAPSGGPFSGNLLPGPLAPAATQYLGTYAENLYDAEADMELGEVIPWSGIFVGAGEDVTFEIY